MSQIDRFRPDERRGVEPLSRRTHGAEAADATRLGWNWQHLRNPHNPAGRFFADTDRWHITHGDADQDH